MSKLHCLDMPEETRELALWLEQHLVGWQLGELVAELRAVHNTAAAPRVSLDDALKDQLPTILSDGLRDQSRATLQILLRDPALLLDLQERVLLQSGPYWEEARRKTNPDKTPLGLSQGFNGFCATPNDKSIPTSAKAAKPLGQAQGREVANVTSHRVRSPRTVLTIVAAIVLVALTIWSIPKRNEQPLAWGWNRSGTFANDVPAEQYRDRLADRADEWQQRPHDTLEQLRSDLLDFRRACLVLLDQPHEPLPAEQRDELKKRCRKWLAKFDEQLAALNSGGDFTEIRTQANETVQKLATAIRKFFPT